MSLVGTRPILQDELQKYELHHRARIAIKPGITGMWQVSGRSDIKANLNAPFRIIYSREARKKIRAVLDDFQPDVVHLNNIQYHLTPSIILEINKWRKETKKE